MSLVTKVCGAVSVKNSSPDATQAMAHRAHADGHFTVELRPGSMPKPHIETPRLWVYLTTRLGSATCITNQSQHRCPSTILGAAPTLGFNGVLTALSGGQDLKL